MEGTAGKVGGLVENTAEKVGGLVENTAERVARTAERLSELTEDAAARVSGTQMCIRDSCKTEIHKGLGGLIILRACHHGNRNHCPSGSLVYRCLLYTSNSPFSDSFCIQAIVFKYLTGGA